MQRADRNDPSQASYETLTALLAAYRLPVVTLLIGIMLTGLALIAVFTSDTLRREEVFRLDLERTERRLDLHARLSESLLTSLGAAAAGRDDDSLSAWIEERTRLDSPADGISEKGFIRDDGALTGGPTGSQGVRQALLQSLTARPVQTRGSEIEVRRLDIAGANGIEQDIRLAYLRRLDENGLTGYLIVEPGVLIRAAGPKPGSYRALLNIGGERAELVGGAFRLPTEFINTLPPDLDWSAPAPFRAFTISLTALPVSITIPSAAYAVLIAGLFVTALLGRLAFDQAWRKTLIDAEVRRITRDLRRSEAELQARNLALSRFAAHAAHDLQSPLRSIQGFSSLLTDRAGLREDPRTTQLIERITSGAERAARLVRGLLDYSKTAGAALQPVTLDFDAVREAVENGLSEDIRQSDARLIWRVETEVKADPFLIERLVFNLCSNALKYRSEARPEIDISVQRSGETVSIAVADNGIGIAPENQHRIFEEFQRLQSRSQVDGHGLGLALCMRIAELHGGALRVESAPGEGSVFTLDLPQGEESEEEAGA